MAKGVSLRKEHKNPTGGLSAKVEIILMLRQVVTCKHLSQKKVVFLPDRKPEKNLSVQGCQR